MRLGNSLLRSQVVAVGGRGAPTVHRLPWDIIQVGSEITEFTANLP